MVSDLKLIGIENYKPYIDYCNNAKIYDEIHNIDLTTEKFPFEDDSFDVVLLDNMINHFLKDISLNLINECKRVSKKRVIIATCDTQNSPEEKSISTDGNEGLKHLSVWSPKELKTLGFHVRGIGMNLFGDGHGHYPKYMKLLGRQLELAALLFPTIGNRMVAYVDV